MRFFFLMLAVWCALGRLSGQNAPDTATQWIPFVTYWNKGDIFNYQMTKGTLTFRDGILTDSTGHRRDFSLSVVDSTAEGYTIRLQSAVESTTLEELGISSEDLDGWAEKFPGFEVEYDISDVGAFRDFRNIEQMAAFYRDVVETTLKRTTDETVRKKNAQLFELLASRSYMREKAFMHIPLLHQFYGMQYARDSILVYEDKIMNLFDPANPFEVPATVQTFQKPEWDGAAVLRQEYTLGEEECAVLLRSVTDNGAPQETTPGRMRMETSASYIFWPDTGVVEAMWFNRQTYVNDVLSREEFIDIELLD